MRTTRRYKRSDNKYFCLNCMDQNWLIECGDGCGGILTRYSKSRQRRYYLKGHQPKTGPYKYKKGSEHPNWKGGRRKRRRYVAILRPNHHTSIQNYILEHRWVYENHYNCCLLPWIDIHHKDGDTLNNKIENLQPLTKEKHTEITTPRKDMSGRFCIICGGKTRIAKHKNGKYYEYWCGNDEDGFICIYCYEFIKRFNKKYK